MPAPRRRPLPLPLPPLPPLPLPVSAPPPDPERLRQPAAVPHGLVVAAGVAWRLLLLAAVGVLLAYVAVRLRLVVVPFVVAVALAAILHGITNALARALPRSLAALVVTLGSTTLLGAVIWLVVRAVQDQSDELVESAIAGLDEVQERLAGLGVDTARLRELQDEGLQALEDNQEQVTAGLLSGATVVAEIVAGLLLTVVLLFFCLRDGRVMWEWAVNQVPYVGARVDLAGRAALGTLAGYLRGTAILGAFDAVLIGLALVVLGVPLAVPLAALVFLGGFIPLVGATLTGAVAVLVALVTEGPVTAGLVLLAVAVVQQVESQVVTPIVLGRTLELHPVAVTASLTAGAVLGGVLGAAAAVPLVAALWAVVRALRTDTPNPRLVGAPVDVVADKAADDALDVADDPELAADAALPPPVGGPTAPTAVDT